MGNTLTELMPRTNQAQDGICPIRLPHCSPHEGYLESPCGTNKGRWCPTVAAPSGGHGRRDIRQNKSWTKRDIL